MNMDDDNDYGGDLVMKRRKATWYSVYPQEKSWKSKYFIALINNSKLAWAAWMTIIIVLNSILWPLQTETNRMDKKIGSKKKPNERQWMS